MASKAYSNNAWISIYKTGLFPTHKVMYCNDKFKLTNEESPNPIRQCNERFNMVSAFSIPMQSIIDMVFNLVKRANFGYKDIMNTEYHFAYFLFDRLNEDIKEENERKQKEQEEQEKEYQRQQQESQFNNIPSFKDLANNFKYN